MPFESSVEDSQYVHGEIQNGTPVPAESGRKRRNAAESRDRSAEAVGGGIAELDPAIDSGDDRRDESRARGAEGNSGERRAARRANRGTDPASGPEIRAPKVASVLAGVSADGIGDIASALFALAAAVRGPHWQVEKEIATQVIGVPVAHWLEHQPRSVAAKAARIAGGAGIGVGLIALALPIAIGEIQLFQEKKLARDLARKARSSSVRAKEPQLALVPGAVPETDYPERTAAIYSGALGFATPNDLAEARADGSGPGAPGVARGGA